MGKVINANIPFPAHVCGLKFFPWQLLQDWNVHAFLKMWTFHDQAILIFCYFTLMSLFASNMYIQNKSCSSCCKGRYNVFIFLEFPCFCCLKVTDALTTAFRQNWFGIAFILYYRPCSICSCCIIWESLKQICEIVNLSNSTCFWRQILCLIFNCKKSNWNVAHMPI